VKLPFDLIVLDLETTGESNHHRIVEIGAVRLDETLEIVDEYQALVDGRPMTAAASRVNHITDEMLVGKPTWLEAYAPWVEWCRKSEKYVLSSFGTYFDLAVLRDEYERFGLKYPHPGAALDAKGAIWWELLKQGYPAAHLSLSTVAEIFRIQVEGDAHRALFDAKVTALGLKACLKPASKPMLTWKHEELF
jgi:DNA polymerase III epsilon subunit-like protein